MKAYWINATTKTIDVVEWSSIADLRRLVGGWIELNRIWDSRDVLYADEEGLMKGGDTWFRLAGKEQPICGNGVVVGPETNKEGEEPGNLDPVITIEELADEIMFITPEQAAAWARANSSEPFVSMTDLGTGETTVLGRTGEAFGQSPQKKG
jgi:hypothetical protein